ncbi:MULTISPECIES: HAD-IA family hydrolase [unclassified Pseudoalteromonas]|uniref:HAD-IA family hydrolase n=1 Tax=unclassified Pseudoalteromonas TaxID=194690 RepID=UPI0025B48171|nr:MULTISPECIES: HAD-IA family hydrolase [unclassified Pseudoalteromonas]MDN3377682.1 HAD-IA family hydrolase [Pseudoalteromonas sp. APC 3893]MDN3385878.1 HAD-IA family hydrolase [Pseudoalteromonas sp. APC 4017]
MKNYKLVIFDWDGTVMDSVTKIVNCMRESALVCGLVPSSDEAIKNIIGLSLEHAVAKLFPGNANLYADLIAQYKHQYKYVDVTPTPLFADVAETLASLKAKGVMLAVATGKSRIGLERLLEETKLGYYFSTTRTSDDAQSKPSPDMLLQLLKELDVSADEALMIGDTKIDMAMAQAAHIDRLGVTMGVHNEAQLNEFEPIATVGSYQQLSALLLD